jgi:RNA polymerase sigma factor for flagellar operon FliA
MSPSQDVEEIWRQYRATPEPQLRNRLVLQYSPLVKYVVGRVRNKLPDTVPQDDLVSDGVLGLIDAIERFEPTPGQSFPTFALPRIRGAIIDGMCSMDFVPRSVREKLRRIRDTRMALEERLGRAPEDAEVAREAGIPLQQVRDLTRQAGPDRAELGDLDDSDDLDDLDDFDTKPQPGEEGPHESE